MALLPSIVESYSEIKSNFLRVPVPLCVFQGYWDRVLGNFLGSSG